jgi:hypothetical protein
MLLRDFEPHRIDNIYVCVTLDFLVILIGCLVGYDIMFVVNNYKYDDAKI